MEEFESGNETCKTLKRKLNLAGYVLLLTTNSSINSTRQASCAREKCADQIETCRHDNACMEITKDCIRECINPPEGQSPQSCFRSCGIGNAPLDPNEFKKMQGLLNDFEDKCQPAIKKCRYYTPPPPKPKSSNEASENETTGISKGQAAGIILFCFAILAGLAVSFYIYTRKKLNENAPVRFTQLPTTATAAAAAESTDGESSELSTYGANNSSWNPTENHQDTVDSKLVGSILADQRA